MRNWRGMRGALLAFLLLTLAGSTGLPGSGQAAAQGVLAAHAEQPLVGPAPDFALAEKYSPIVMLKRQPRACDRTGEPYVPGPVDLVLETSPVRLMGPPHDGEGPDEVLVEAPTATDLYYAPAEAYLDLPGNPRDPGCTYERFGRERMESFRPLTYAHIAVSRARQQVALQYHFYYVFNDFNNTHESDWEMIQLLFDAPTVVDALRVEPSSVAYAQHGGGETAEWDSPKFTREGNHPIVYSAAGSHASYYGSDVYLGWGQNGTGFGCDITTGPSVRVPLAVELVPSRATQATTGQAWLGFDGRWGERQPWEYNGPQGPPTTRRWIDPFEWQEGLRSSSISIAGAKTYGPGPTQVFCDITEFGSRLLTLSQVYPRTVTAVATIFVVVPLALIWFGRGVIRDTISFYRRYWRIFALLGLMLIPIGLVANGVRSLVINVEPGKTAYHVMERSEIASFLVASLIGSVQGLISTIIIGPAAIYVVKAALGGRQPSFVGAYRSVFRALWDLVVAVRRPAVIVGLLALTVIGLPLAFVLSVRWLFTAQAFVLDGARGREAERQSAAVVRGHWFRTALLWAMISLLGSAPGPVIGILLMVYTDGAVHLVNATSSLVYAVTLPASVIAVTMLYLRLQGRQYLPDPLPARVESRRRWRLARAPEPAPPPTSAANLDL